MSDADKGTVPSGGDLVAEEEEDVDEIRLGFLIDDLSSTVNGNYSREDLTQALIAGRYDVRAAHQWLYKRERTPQRQSPDKRREGYEVDNMRVHYQLPALYCCNSAFVFENRTVERVPVGKMVRDWLTDILRKRSRLKREEERNRYMRGRNESMCSEDSVVTTSGDNPDVLGDSSQDLSEDSQEMIIDDFEQDCRMDEMLPEPCQGDLLPTDQILTLPHSDSKEEKCKNTLNSNMQRLSMDEPGISSKNIAVPQLVIPPLKKTINQGGETAVAKSELDINKNESEYSSKVDENCDTLLQPSFDSRGCSLSDLANSCLNQTESGGSSLSDPTKSGLNPGHTFNVAAPGETDVNSNNSNLNKESIGPSLSALAASTRSSDSTFSVPKLNMFGQVPSSSVGTGKYQMSFSSLPNQPSVNIEQPKNYRADTSGPSLSALATSNFSGGGICNPNGGSLGSSLSALASASLGENSQPSLSSIPKLPTGPSLSSLCNSSVGNLGGIAIPPPVGINPSEKSSFESGSPSLSTLANSFLGSSPLSVTSIPPLQTGKKGESTPGDFCHGSSPFSGPSILPPQTGKNEQSALSSLANSFIGSTPLSSASIPPLQIGKKEESGLSALANSCIGSNSSPATSIPPLQIGKKELSGLSALADSSISSTLSLSSIPPLHIGKKEEVGVAASTDFSLGSSPLSLASIPPLQIGRGKEEPSKNHVIVSSEMGEIDLSAPVMQDHPVVFEKMGFSGCQKIHLEPGNVDPYSKTECSRPPPGFLASLNNFVNAPLDFPGALSPGGNMLLQDQVVDQSFLSPLASLAISSTGPLDPDILTVPCLNPSPGIKPPPGFEHLVSPRSLPEKECLETLLQQGEEADINGDIDLLSALLKPQEKEDAVMETDKHVDVLVIDLPQNKGKYDKMLLKDRPSSFGRVMVNMPRLPRVKRLNEKTIYVPFKIFKFDTPSPDERIQQALQNRSDPGWYKLVTKERHSRRKL